MRRPAGGLRHPALLAASVAGAGLVHQWLRQPGEWPDRLFHVTRAGTSSVLLDSREAKRYLNDFVLFGDRLIVPNWEPSSVSAYHLRR